MFPTWSTLITRLQHSHFTLTPSLATKPRLFTVKPRFTTRSTACSRLNTRNSISFTVATSPYRAIVTARLYFSVCSLFGRVVANFDSQTLHRCSDYSVFHALFTTDDASSQARFVPHAKDATANGITSVQRSPTFSLLLDLFAPGKRRIQSRPITSRRDSMRKARRS